ncbi:MAG: Kae1-like domain-containing protein, partial [Limisphaerales bacterium]
SGIADFFLVHNRPIVRHADDSIVRCVLGQEMLVRGGRGYAPICIPTPNDTDTIFAVGAHLKNTVALKRGDTTVISQHIGDLETKEAHCAFKKIAADLQNFYEAKPDLVVCDLHPDYSSTSYARELGIPVVTVQHHYAHVLSCLADNELEPAALGVAWDGTGLGTDGTIWGGEFLSVNDGDFERVAHLRTFRLPGGDSAAKQPCRSALGLLYEIFGKEMLLHRKLPPFANCSKQELTIVHQMLERDTNAPLTSSMGRLFDAVASIVGLRHKSSFEGQAAMDLEFAAAQTSDAYPILIREGKPLIADWEPMVISLLDDVAAGVAAETIATKFHNTLVEVVVQIAERIGEEKIVLTGGCFQNKLLLTGTIARLKQRGFRPYWHQRVPTNDGGIALGQIFAAVNYRWKVKT